MEITKRQQQLIDAVMSGKLLYFGTRLYPVARVVYSIQYICDNADNLSTAGELPPVRSVVSEWPPLREESAFKDGDHIEHDGFLYFVKNAEGLTLVEYGRRSGDGIYYYKPTTVKVLNVYGFVFIPKGKVHSFVLNEVVEDEACDTYTVSLVADQFITVVDGLGIKTIVDYRDFYKYKSLGYTSVPKRLKDISIKGYLKHNTQGLLKILTINDKYMSVMLQDRAHYFTVEDAFAAGYTYSPDGENWVDLVTIAALGKFK